MGDDALSYRSRNKYPLARDLPHIRLCCPWSKVSPGQGRKTMDEQPSAFRTWLTIDLSVIAISIVIIGIGIWIGL